MGTVTPSQPACMTDDEYVLWSAANRSLSRRASAPCFDCPREFAVEMRREECCNGEPQDNGRPRLLNDAAYQRKLERDRRSAAAYRARRAS